MLLVKIWWSLIAPKDKEGIDENYLQKISSFFLNFENIFITHWTGNIWHWRIKSLIKDNPWKDLRSLLINDFKNGRQILDIYFKKVDDYFSWFNRIYVEKFIKENKNNFKSWKYIIWGDVLSTWEIISSDDIIWEMINYDFIELVLILTDVDGVYDKNWQIIQNITKDNFDQIDFWNKKNDVTWGMKQKVLKILNTWKKAIICNWKNFDNLEKRLTLWKWLWTVIW